MLKEALQGSSSNGSGDSYKHLTHQISLLNKLTIATIEKGSSDKAVTVKILKKLLEITKEAITCLVAIKKAEEEEEDEEIEDEKKTNKYNEEEDIDLNAGRFAFSAIKLLLEINSDAADIANEVLDAAVEVLAKLNDHLSLRDSVMEVIPSSLAILKANKHSEFEEQVNEVIKTVVGNMQAETDHRVLVDQLELIQNMLLSVGKCFENAEIVKNIMIFLFEVCEGAAKNVAEIQKVTEEE